MKKKTYLFVDGSNFYAGQYELFGPHRYLDFSKLITQLERKINIVFDRIYFYASYSPKPNKPSDKQKLYLKNEALFYKSVKSVQKVAFFKGYRSKTSGKEKEVDVKLAVDMVDFAHRKLYDQMYLVSGDADFMEAMFAIRRLNKKIAVLCLENKTMFRAFAFFNTFVIIFKHSPVFRKLTKTMVNNMSILKIEKEKVIKRV